VDQLTHLTRWTRWLDPKMATATMANCWSLSGAASSLSMKASALLRKRVRRSYPPRDGDPMAKHRLVENRGEGNF